MLKLIILFLILGAVPLILGLPWGRKFHVRYTVVFAYGTGYFLELVLFHVIAFLFAFFRVPFHLLTVVFSILLVFACVISCLYSRKAVLFPKKTTIRAWVKFQWHEWILLIVFVLLFSYQVYRGIVSDLTYMSYDDSAYIAMANDALAVDYIGITEAYTGEAIALNLQRVIQTSLYFPAYLSAVSGISVVVMEHTVQYTQLLFLAYAIYIFISGELFEKRENRLVFLVFISVFYIFGYHSHYSLTFRLLGPNYQGKAILAVSLTPLVLSILIRALREAYRIQTGVLLLLLSTAAVSLTLWGTGTMVVIVTIPVVLSLFRQERNWKHLWYIPWGIIIPVASAVFYTVFKSSL